MHYITLSEIFCNINSKHVRINSDMHVFLSKRLFTKCFLFLHKPHYMNLTAKSRIRHNCSFDVGVFSPSKGEMCPTQME